MQNQSTVHVSSLVLVALAIVFWRGGLDDLGPLTTGMEWLCEQLGRVLHADCWMRLLGAGGFSGSPRP